MSHVAKFQTAVVDLEALKRALIRMGIKPSQIEIHNQAIQAHGFHENETFMANLIVRRTQDFGSDIGWERTKEGQYAAHLDDFNYNGIQHYDTDWQTRLYTLYNVEKSKIELESRNIEYEETKDERGRYQIRARFQLDRGSRIRTGR
jgi:hypothetical protein